MKTKEPDYRALFGFGIILVGTGVTFLTSVSKPLGSIMIGIGGIYMMMGAKHKDQWRENGKKKNKRRKKD